MCLATLAANPSLPVQQALIAGASMGACHLADSMDPTDTTLIQGCLNVARSSVVLTKAKFHADDEPIEDLSAWKQGITHQVSQVLGQASVDTSALVLWWMGLKTLAWVEYEVSNGTLRGLERLILASLHVATIQKNQRTLPIAQQLTYAIFGLGAIHGLRALLHTPDAFQSLRERYQEVLHEAALDLDLMSPATMEDQWSVDAIYAGLNEPIANPTQTALRPLMVLALTTMHGAEAIPGGPAWVFQHAGA